jgi:hypothetical protein
MVWKLWRLPRIHWSLCRGKLATSYAVSHMERGYRRGAEGPLLKPPAGGSLLVTTQNRDPGERHVATRIRSCSSEFAPTGPHPAA